jgi:hypothetical protein
LSRAAAAIAQQSREPHHAAVLGDPLDPRRDALGQIDKHLGDLLASKV